MRNTPTHVGKTLTLFLGGASCRKHPHARGEDENTPRERARAMETPPRTWGRRNAMLFRRMTVRNTPTHVGKTFLNFFDFS